MNDDPPTAVLHDLGVWLAIWESREQDDDTDDVDIPTQRPLAWRRLLSRPRPRNADRWKR